jgi:DNA (cytosine-5)-methyltransferase 1
VDTTKTITHIGLCAGYGGIELGLARVLPTLRSVALCEIEAFPIANLVAKMEAGLLDATPIWTDLKTFPWESFRDRVDILTGGYPCQPFSAAGKRAGKEDPRHLWPWIADGIRILRPKVCFFENVEGHISLGLSSVISDLEELGYKVSWGIFSAREVGAPHQRKRVFILAHDAHGEQRAWSLLRQNWQGATLLERCGSGRAEELADTKDQYGRHTIGPEAQDTKSALRCQYLWPSRPGEPQHGWEPPRVVAHSKLLGRRGRSDGDAGGLCGEIQTAGSCGGWSEVREAQPPLGGNPDGTSDWMDYAELYTTCDNRTDELRLLGNGVVPATAERAFRTLTELLANKQP